MGSETTVLKNASAMTSTSALGWMKSIGRLEHSPGNAALQLRLTSHTPNKRAAPR